MLFYGGWIGWYFTSHSCGKSVARVMTDIPSYYMLVPRSIPRDRVRF